MSFLQVIETFISSHWYILVAGVIGLIVPSVIKTLTWLRAKGDEYVIGKLEHLRSEINANNIAAQLQADDAIINILESFLPELINELDDTIQREISTGKISSLDWTDLGARLWAKGRAEVETGVTNYMAVSEEQDGKVIAALVAKKFFLKQAALQKGTIVPH